MSPSVDLQLLKVKIVSAVRKMMAARLRQDPGTASILCEIVIVRYSCSERVLTAIINQQGSMGVDEVIEERGTRPSSFCIACPAFGTSFTLEGPGVSGVFGKVDRNPSTSPSP